MEVLLCLFGVFRPTRERFTHGEVVLAGKGLKILTSARNLWPLSIEGSYYCAMGHLFIIVISRTRDTEPNTECLAVELSLPVFTT